MADLRVIIIDDDRQRREQIKQILPEYMESLAIGYGEGAIDYIKPDQEDNVPDLVILYGDDRKSFGLYILDWMLNKSPDPRIARIPVIVITEDEFSDRSMEFLELGDVTFYEGEIDESSLFSVITETIEEAEFAAEPIEPAYEETKSIDRLMGHSVKAPGEIGKQRALVLDMDTRLDNLEAALARGKKRVEDIRTLMDAAQKAKSGDDEFAARRKRRDPKESEAYVKRMTSFLDKAREKAAVEEPKTVRTPAGPAAGSVEDSINRLKQKAITNPYGAFNAQGTIRVEERPKSPTPAVPQKPVQAAPNNSKRTVVITDDDVKTRKLCALFLTQNYNVVALDSGMKTIDLFIKGRADLLIINPMMKGMNGLMTVSSIRMQKGCTNVPVMYIVGDDFTGDRTTLIGNGVVGILNKPIKREVLSQAVDGFFRSPASSWK